MGKTLSRCPGYLYLHYLREARSSCNTQRMREPEPSCFLAQSIVVEAYFVYGLYQHGKLFYVGKTNQPHSRLNQHRTHGHARVRAFFGAGPVTMRILSIWLTDTQAWHAEQKMIRKHKPTLVNGIVQAKSGPRKPRKKHAGDARAVAARAYRARLHEEQGLPTLGAALARLRGKR